MTRLHEVIKAGPLALALLTLLSGCASAPVETGKLSPPARYLMTAPCRLPAIPADEGNPAVRAAYYAGSRSCHGRTMDQVEGLQRYIKKVRGS